MKIEVLEDRLRSVDPETGERYNLEKGDRVTVSDACGAQWCALGWAEDMAGEVETGERKPGVARLDVHNAAHKTTDSNPEG